MLRVAYDGTAYHGWQRQAGYPTIQGELEAALSRLFQDELSVQGCSRTDAGVHALDQKVLFCPPSFPVVPRDNTLRYLNDALPLDIRVVSIQEVPTDFHPRSDSVGKAYTYMIWRDRHMAPFLHRYAWRFSKGLEVGPMHEAAATLAGTYDFTAFSAIDHSEPDRDPIRTISGVFLKEYGDWLGITVVGESFLYKMVRCVVGFLVAVGCGRLGSDAAPAILAARQRNAQFDTAPAIGLFLEKVFLDRNEMAAFRPEAPPFLQSVPASENYWASGASSTALPNAVK